MLSVLGDAYAQVSVLDNADALSVEKMVVFILIDKRFA